MHAIYNLLLVIVSNNGETILSETHNLFLGPEGLLRVPVRLGLSVEDLICFPTKKAQDPSHIGAPFSALYVRRDLQRQRSLYHEQVFRCSLLVLF